MNMTRAWGRRVAAVAAVLSLAAACTMTRPSRPAFHPQLAWSQCPSDVEIQFLSRHRCGWLTVLQDRAKPTGRTIRLLVVQTWPVGVAPLPGIGIGFGTNLGDAYSYGDTAAGATRLQRTGVSLELRGTGHSEPSLACPEVSALDGRKAGGRGGDASLLNQFVSAVKACRDRLVGEGVDPARFDLESVARDTEDLRMALGVDRWAFANSYGTSSRYLFEYLRAFPGRVRAAYLDSPQFPQVDEVTAGVNGTRQALKQLFVACAADKACGKAYPDLAGLWARAVQRLQRQPLQGAVMVDAATLLRASRFALGGDGPRQRPLNLTQLPDTIAAAAQGRISGPLAAALADSPLYCPGYRPLCIGVGDQGFSLGAYLTVLCRDQAPFIDRTALATAIGDDPALRKLVEDHPYVAACEVWGVTPANPAVARPVHTEVPLLLLVGQFDSYSSAAEARQVAATLPRAWVVQVPGSTHNALGFSDCPIGIRNAWVQDPTGTPLDTSCLHKLRVSFAAAP
jgi:pimeloyl-ACP methyl ester carboxylesterase